MRAVLFPHSHLSLLPEDLNSPSRLHFMITCSITGVGTTRLLSGEELGRPGYCQERSWEDQATVSRGGTLAPTQLSSCGKYLAVHRDRCWQWGRTQCGDERPALLGHWRETLPYQCPCESVRGVEGLHVMQFEQALFRLTNLMGKFTMVGFFSIKKLFFVKRWGRKKGLGLNSKTHVRWYHNTRTPWCTEWGKGVA